MPNEKNTISNLIFCIRIIFLLRINFNKIVNDISDKLFQINYYYKLFHFANWEILFNNYFFKLNKCNGRNIIEVYSTTG